MIRAASVLALVLAAAPLAAQEAPCLADDQSAMDTNPTGFDAAMRSVVTAHMPIEFRNSCGLLGDADLAFYVALARELNCADSASYHTVFAEVLKPQQSYLFAAGASEFADVAGYATYCELVARIDMPGFLTQDGALNRAHLDTQTPLFQDILAFVAQHRLP